MTIGGGTFTVQNKTLPGAYINFVGVGAPASMGARGIVALPLELNWGPEKQVITVTAGDFSKDAMKVFGYGPTDDALVLVREALKRSSKLLCYRVNAGGQKAEAEVGGMTVTAVYGGTRGNDIAVSIAANADDSGKVDVITYVDMIQVDIQTVAGDTGAGLVENQYVKFGAAAALTVTAPVKLSGGTNQTVTGQNYADFLAAIEVESFNAVGYPGTDESVKALVGAFVKRLRSDEGKKVVGVLYEYVGDDMGLINVKNGVVLTDGTVLPGDKAVCWVAGATAGAEVNQSLTNTAYDGAVDVDKKYTKSEYEAAVQAGEFVFYADSGKARVLTDINSLTTFGQGVSSDWTSNRVVRVMDGWANDVARIFGERYMGLVTNSDTGRQLFKADLVSLANQYMSIDAISNFAADDVVVQQGMGKRDVAVDTVLQPNDSMEKLYMTVVVQ